MADKNNLNSDKFERISRAAIDLFSSQGIQETSISQITSKAGIAKGTFYLYFDSKQTLVDYIFNYCFDLHLNASLKNIDKQTTIIEKLKQRVKNIILWTSSHPKESQIIRYFYGPVNVVGTERVAFEKSYSINKDFIKEGIENGEIKDLPIDFIFSIFFSTVEGISSYIRANPHFLENESVFSEMLDSMVDSIRN